MILTFVENIQIQYHNKGRKGDSQKTKFINGVTRLNLRNKCQNLQDCAIKPQRKILS